MKAIGEQDVTQLVRQGICQVVWRVASDVDFAKLDASFATAGQRGSYRFRAACSDLGQVGGVVGVENNLAARLPRSWDKSAEVGDFFAEALASECRRGGLSGAAERARLKVLRFGEMPRPSSAGTNVDFLSRRTGRQGLRSGDNAGELATRQSEDRQCQSQ